MPDIDQVDIEDLARLLEKEGLTPDDVGILERVVLEPKLLAGYDLVDKDDRNLEPDQRERKQEVCRSLYGVRKRVIDLIRTEGYTFASVIAILFEDKEAAMNDVTSGGHAYTPAYLELTRHLLDKFNLRGKNPYVGLSYSSKTRLFTMTYGEDLFRQRYGGPTELYSEESAIPDADSVERKVEIYFDENLNMTGNKTSLNVLMSAGGWRDMEDPAPEEIFTR